MAQQKPGKILVNKKKKKLWLISSKNHNERSTTPTAQFELPKVAVYRGFHHSLSWSSPAFRLSSWISQFGSKRGRRVTKKSVLIWWIFPRTIHRSSPSELREIPCDVSAAFREFFSAFVVCRKPSRGWGVVVVMQHGNRVWSRAFPLVGFNQSGDRVRSDSVKTGNFLNLMKLLFRLLEITSKLETQRPLLVRSVCRSLQWFKNLN